MKGNTFLKTLPIYRKLRASGHTTAWSVSLLSRCRAGGYGKPLQHGRINFHKHPPVGANNFAPPKCHNSPSPHLTANHFLLPVLKILIHRAPPHSSSPFVKFHRTILDLAGILILWTFWLRLLLGFVQEDLNMATRDVSC